MMTLPGAGSPALSLDLAGGFTTAISKTVIRMKPPSMSRAVSSQTVSVSSSIDLAEQAQIDLQPQVRADAQERRVERDIHAFDDCRDHRLDLVRVGRAAGLGRGEGDDQADDGAEQPDPHHMGGEPLHVVPAPPEDTDDAERAHADDQPA